MQTCTHRREQDLFVEMRIDLCIDVCMDMCIDMSVDMCIGRCADMCVNMCIPVVRDKAPLKCSAVTAPPHHGQ